MDLNSMVQYYVSLDNNEDTSFSILFVVKGVYQYDGRGRKFQHFFSIHFFIIT